MSGRGGGFTPTAEVDQALWLPVPEARTMLTHQRDITVLDALAKATTVDAVLLLVRHASGAPALDGPGHRQVRALRHLLPGFAPGRLLCVPDEWRRDTLTPLAARLRLPVAYGRDLLEAGGCHRRAGDPHWVRDLAAEGGTTVVAAPGSVIRNVITTLACDDHVKLPRVRARKGSVWALFFNRARLTGADYYARLVEPGH
jgi:8-oxo-dGTP diphosphatase